jgi:hypothetical protein
MNERMNGDVEKSLEVNVARHPFLSAPKRRMPRVVNRQATKTVAHLIGRFICKPSLGCRILKHGVSFCMAVTESHAVNLPVFVMQFLFASRLFAYEVGWVIPISIVSNGAGTLDGHAAARRGAERVVCFVIVVFTEWLPIEDIERLVRKGFLSEQKRIQSDLFIVQ